MNIDFSSIPHPSPVTQADQDWDPPNHVFYGKRLEGGKKEREPTYVYKPFPKFLYGLVDGVVTPRLVNSEAELDALGDGWTEDLASLGVITAPSFEQTQAQLAQASAESSGKEVEAKPAAKPKPGRKPAAKVEPATDNAAEEKEAE